MGKDKKESRKSRSSKHSTPSKMDSKTNLKEEEGPSSTVVAAAAALGGEDVDFELSSLNAVGAEASADRLYAALPDDVFSAFDQLQGFARDLNTHLPTPEFVLVGPAGGGKTALLEAILGDQFAGSAAASTTRPVHYNIVHSASADTPKVTLKRDLVSKQADKEVDVADLGAEVAVRCETASNTPVIVTIEMKSTCNMTLIDAPGLDKSAEREELVLALVRPNHRRVVAVETAADWSAMSGREFAKKFDPELTRTVFVYTNFQNHLQSFTNTREVNGFFAKMIPGSKTYFTSLPSAGVRATLSDTDGYREKVAQAEARDVNLLEQLQFDKSFEHTVGIGALRRHLLSVSWKSYQDSVPLVLKQLRQQKSDLNAEASALEAEIKALDTSKLRQLASNYVVDFLQVIDQLIAGTSVGNPSVNGQDLNEEKTANGDGDWTDQYNRVISFDAQPPYAEAKVYGGQQFERLLAEFKAVSESRDLDEDSVTTNDVATSAGVNKLNNQPNHHWSAADLAQQKSQDSFVPLIEQVTNRAVYIIKRLTDIAEKIIDSRRKERGVSAVSSLVEDVSSYPYFTYHVKDVFYHFVDDAAKNCREKCLDEFYSTRTVYWELMESGAQIKVSDDAEATVKQLAAEVFTKLQKRITANVMLKLYNFFLVPVQSDLATVLQGNVNTLTDGELEKLFDTAQTKERLEGALEKVQSKLEASSETDKHFIDAANTFSHPVKALSD